MGEIIAAILFFLIVKAVKGDKKQKKKADKPVQPAPQPAKTTQGVTNAARELARELAGDEIKALNDFLFDQAPAQSVAQPAAPAKPIPPAPPKPKMKTSIELAMESFQQMGAPKKPTSPRLTLAEGEAAPGESFTDEHGCVGGSLAHDSAEGEKLNEHAEHERRRRERLAAEAAQAMQPVRKVTAKDLRRAVVMSEILNRPKALRR